MQFTSDHAILSDVKGTSVKITRDTCRDFVYFRQLLRDARRLDDNIGNTLNKIDIADPRMCSELMNAMAKTHKERMNSLKFCMSVLEDDVSLAQNQPKAKILQKELGLLESECSVEEIVYERTEISIRSKCKSLP